MKVLVCDLIDFIGKDLLSVFGNPQGAYIDNLADLRNVNKYTLDWVASNKVNKQVLITESRANTILVDNTVEYTEKLRDQGKILLVVKNPKRVLAEIGNHYFVNKPKPGIHSTAIIAEGATIGKDVYIGPYCLIDKAIIGDNCVIEGSAHICDNVILGKSCVVKNGAVIGGEGFGFERDENGNQFRFPQIGGVIIGDFVEIGANTCIDRGALSNTVIGNYTKINNLCHIAHNNTIGNNVTITGCVNISGSNIIDDNVWIAPNATIRGFVHLGQGCVVGMGAVVTKDIPAGQTWIGNPAREIKK